ncbi:MAG: transposase [Candidatus Peribacteraceae bacterium]|nr:transposase [Candidatus Peribacteraceae bacterium]
MSQRHFIQNDEMMLVTTITFRRQKFFLNPALAREAIDQLYRLQQIIPFFLFGFVIMPNHCHFLINVPAPARISSVMRSFKMGLSFQTGISPLWQPRFDIRCVKNGGEALHYIHSNPVKEQLVKDARDYPWSSATGTWDVTPLGL